METLIRNLQWGKEVLLAPVGDVQLGSQGFHESLFKKHMAEVRERDGLVIGMGDMVDVASPSNRRALRNADLYDSVRQALDEKANDHVQKFLRYVDGTKWLGLVKGHHFWVFQSGDTSDTRIAQALETRFLGTSAFITLVFRDEDKLRCTYTIWLHHGCGGGITPGAPLNKLAHVTRGFRADLYLMGHQHKQVHAAEPELFLNHRSGKIEHRDKHLVGTGSFLRGYMQNSVGDGLLPGGLYPEERMLNPVTLGAPLIRLIPRSNHGEYWIETRVEQG